VNCEEHKDEESHRWDRCTEKIWRTSICFAPHDEGRIFERSKMSVDELISLDEASGTSRDFFNATLTQPLPSDASEARELRKAAIEGHPHESCRALLTILRSDQEKLDSQHLEYHKRKEHILPLQFLRVCRQTYIEANPLLWSNNTLSFDSPSDSKDFMADRIDAQKANITHLHLDMSRIYPYWYHFHRPSSAASLGIIKSLVGLRSLSIYISDWVDHDRLVREVGDDETAQITEWKRLVKEHACDELTHYKILPLANVMVLMVNMDAGPYESPNGTENWRRGERMKYAETIRQTILDVDGPQKFEKEQAEAKVAQQAKTANRKLTSPPCRQASTADECAQMNQNRRKKKSPPCYLDHVCLICFNDLKKDREAARYCPTPGACIEGYFKITVNKYREVTIHTDDDIKTVLEKWVSVNRSCPWKSSRSKKWVASFRDIELVCSSTVQEVGLKVGDHVDVSLHDSKKKADDS
jgi:hypothetical protein